MLAFLRKPNAGMQAVDIDIMVRYLVGDHPAQAEKARRRIGRELVSREQSCWRLNGC
jgi:hypothetical protein